MDAEDITTAEELRLRRLDMLRGVRLLLKSDGAEPEWVAELEWRVS